MLKLSFNTPFRNTNPLNTSLIKPVPYFKSRGCDPERSAGDYEYESFIQTIIKIEKGCYSIFLNEI